MQEFYSYSQPITDEKRKKMIKTICSKLSEKDYFSFNVHLFDETSETIIMYKNDTLNDLRAKIKHVFSVKRNGNHFMYAKEIDDIPAPSFEIRDIILYNQELNELFCIPKNKNQTISDFVKENSARFKKNTENPRIYTLHVMDENYYNSVYLKQKKQSCVIS
jgi:hypothetical protein